MLVGSKPLGPTINHAATTPTERGSPTSRAASGTRRAARALDSGSEIESGDSPAAGSGLITREECQEMDSGAKDGPRGDLSLQAEPCAVPSRHATTACPTQ